MYTDIYLSNVEDIGKYPNEKWKHAGVIDLNVCPGSLEWSKCGSEWREYAQISNYQKALKST